MRLASNEYVINSVVSLNAPDLITNLCLCLYVVGRQQTYFESISSGVWAERQSDAEKLNWFEGGYAILLFFYNVEGRLRLSVKIINESKENSINQIATVMGYGDKKVRTLIGTREPTTLIKGILIASECFQKEG